MVLSPSDQSKSPVEQAPSDGLPPSLSLPPASSEAVIVKPPSEPVRVTSPPPLISIGDTAGLQEEEEEEEEEEEKDKPKPKANLIQLFVCIYVCSII